jgi:hypothetical protein
MTDNSPLVLLKLPRKAVDKLRTATGHFLDEEQTMSQGYAIAEARESRPGVCHRCGWKGMVTKISRSARQAMEEERPVRRLCHECASDLVRADSETADPTATRVVDLKSTRRQHVA